ncbi:type I-E CRISPR-associated protein Cse2/CasB [uncultured Sphaerochaeta sp.]|uniref:type I-E CRISPR-associated protein Cse2/CasB n=1 Tax=uncultured Sphaerochaeta sp. TaxID=886478 RepID=UPI0029CA8DEE|nr:type I-E CRISPR-associated protein Cse2/CasB [uncultured Sphaerochaeta sp.]
MENNKVDTFINWVLSKNRDKGFIAKLRKADSETTEYQAWEILARWIDLDNPWQRRAFGLIGASITRVRAQKDGDLGLGSALRRLYLQHAKESEIERSAEALRLRRILSCRDQRELVAVLKPLLRYLVNNEIAISHTRLLKELLWFDHERAQERIRIRWAKEFYAVSSSAEEDLK